MKQVKVEWCENFIRSAFRKHCLPGGGIEVNCFWDMAERAGLWERDTYNTPMSDALRHLVTVESRLDDDGRFLYSVFRLVQ